jgi:hypothetical protein
MENHKHPQRRIGTLESEIEEDVESCRGSFERFALVGAANAPDRSLASSIRSRMAIDAQNIRAANGKTILLLGRLI